jgi:hypothetical protein
MKKTLNFNQILEPKTHFTCQYLDYTNQKRYSVQGTLETSRGKQTVLEIDFAEQTVKSSNKLFKITWKHFQKADYYE